jgi:GxxExxY protein
LVSLKISAPYLQKRLASVNPRQFQSWDEQRSDAKENHVEVVIDRVVKSEPMEAIEKYRRVKIEDVEVKKFPVDSCIIEPKHFVQRHNIKPERDPEPVVYRLSDVSLGQFRTPTYVETTVPTITWEQIIGLCLDAYAQNGVGHSERLYQDSVFWKLYHLGIAAVRERPLIVEEEGFTVNRGRTDLEIASKFLLEFKICPPTIDNIRKSQTQIKRYVRTYSEKGQEIEKAAVVFFGSFGEMRVVEVRPASATHRYSPY